MVNAKRQTALQQYRQVGAQSAVSYASPHRLVLMLLEGALDRIAAARGHMGRGEVAEKANQISRALGILEGLRMGVNKQAGGDIARNLDDLYEYMSRRLVEANAGNQPGPLEEVQALLGEIRDAWAMIPEATDSASPLNPTAAVEAPAVG